MKDPRAELVAKALKEPAFRAELLKDPAAAVEKATGVKVPAGLTVKVVEDSASVVHLVLPPAGPLSEKALGKVAGGASCLDSTRYKVDGTAPVSSDVEKFKNW